MDLIVTFNILHGSFQTVDHYSLMSHEINEVGYN
jgi:hypothetical protein